ncbi:hypothetical protein RISK_002298 [Rhodopirellula islandica]|uniref:Uncharacterized protein n=1 Tax=Rhodopirellula islandica TaxID=595434 RepID=A0A0J1BGL6_RHOIS|nr:hypothetical protein RISK_002298 [Rhodopirellula islandica]
MEATTLAKTFQMPKDSCRPALQGVFCLSRHDKDGRATLMRTAGF